MDAVLAEVGGGLVALLAWHATTGWAGFVALALFGWSLLLLALLDFRHLWLPERVTLPLLAAGCAIGPSGILPAHDTTERLLGAAVGFIGLELFRLGFRAVRKRDGLGAGDARLLGAIGAWLGIASLAPVLLAGSCLGLAHAALLRVQGQAQVAAVPLPLGTWLALAALALMPVFA